MQVNNYGYKGFESPSSVFSSSQLRSAKTPFEAGNEQGAVTAAEGDAYVPGGMDFSSSGVYSAPRMPAMSEVSPAESGDDLMSQMSDAFRANEDSIRAAMEELGLSEEDLESAENMALLANAMNEGAAKLGVPQIEDVDAAVEELMNIQATGGSSEKATAGAPGVAGGAGGAGAPAGAGGAGGAENSDTSSDSDADSEETTSKIVMVNGTPYLETTTVKDGVTTKTLTAMGGGGSIRRESMQPFAGADTSRPYFMGSYGAYNFNRFNVA